MHDSFWFNAANKAMTDSTPIASFIDEDANSEQTLTEVEGNARVRQKTVMIEFPKDELVLFAAFKRHKADKYTVLKIHIM